MTFTKFSGWKHSTIINPVTENGLPEVVTVETVTNCFWFKSASSQRQGIFHIYITRSRKGIKFPSRSKRWYSDCKENFRKAAIIQ